MDNRPTQGDLQDRLRAQHQAYIAARSAQLVATLALIAARTLIDTALAKFANPSWTEPSNE